jgi:VWFA-related protein
MNVFGPTYSVAIQKAFVLSLVLNACLVGTQLPDQRELLPPPQNPRSPRGAEQADAAGSLRPDFRFTDTVREVVVVFRAVDGHSRPVSGITSQEIQVVDEGRVREIASFSTDVANAQVVVLVDVSGSMQPVLGALQGALSTFADLVSQDARHEAGDVLLTLIPFSQAVTPLIDRTSNSTEFKEAVLRLRSTGSTALVDAVLASLRFAFEDNDPLSRSGSRQERKRSKFLVIFTDAGENSSGHSWSEIASEMLGKEVVIYSIAFDSGAPESDFAKLSKVSTESGGRMYRANPNNLERIYKEIAKDVRSHYQLTFSAGDVVDSRGWRNITVSTSRSGVTVFARTGYCPETPCQKKDGAFVGERPKTWGQIRSLSLDPALTHSLKDHLRNLRFESTEETDGIVRKLAREPIFVEKDVSGGNSGSARFLSYAAGKRNYQVNIDAEVCALNIEAEANLAQTRAGTVSAESRSTSVFMVESPEVRVARRPARGDTPVASTVEDYYFQSQAIFYLSDIAGRFPSRIRVQCNRPHFLVGEQLVEFTIQALAHGLKVVATETH